ncbi:6153_t:CDS:2 [Entrophospora sp. SA101]|nr:6153_t:CDS:2 [Entrophospora sp. SA101]
MGKVKKRVQHLREIAQIPRKNTFKKVKSLFSQKNDLVEWNEEFYEAEYQEEYEESRVELSSDESDVIEWVDEEGEATIESLYEKLIDNMQKLPKSNRPNIYLKKSRTTLYRFFIKLFMMSTVFLWVILVYPLTFYISTQKEEFYKAVVFNKHYITKKGSLEMMPKIQTLYIKHLKPFPEVEEFIEESIKHYNLGLIIIEESMKKALEKYSELKPEVKGILIGVRNDLHGDWPQFM